MVEVKDNNIQKLLNSAYNTSIKGLPKFSTATELAEKYLERYSSTDEAINSLIRHQNAKASSFGFTFGLGGLIVLPVLVPANIVSVLYVQMRMVAAIAHMRGFDVMASEIKTLVFVALTGNSAEKILKGTGLKMGGKMIGKKIFERTIRKQVTSEALTKINQKVGFRLVTKFGQRGLVSLSRLVPIVGGLIGGSHDFLSTNIIGKVAKNKLFIDQFE